MQLLVRRTKISFICLNKHLFFHRCGARTCDIRALQTAKFPFPSFVCMLLPMPRVRLRSLCPRSSLGAVVVVRDAIGIVALIRCSPGHPQPSSSSFPVTALCTSSAALIEVHAKNTAPEQLPASSFCIFLRYRTVIEYYRV